MPKLKKPNTITMLTPMFTGEEELVLYAVNRKARRELLKIGARFVAVPMPTLRAYGNLKGAKTALNGNLKGAKSVRKYDMVTAEGARLPFTPQYDNSAARKAARGKYR